VGEVSSATVVHLKSTFTREACLLINVVYLIKQRAGTPLIPSPEPHTLAGHLEDREAESMSAVTSWASSDVTLESRVSISTDDLELEHRASSR